MKLYISYFYQIRFFTPDMVPISTALYDPKWYRFKAPYVDKRGVLNGYRMPIFNIPDDRWAQLEEQDLQCRRNCHMELPCAFMKTYKEYLDTLDFDTIMASLQTFEKQLNWDHEATFVLMVHESKQCQCAERPVLQEWFREHGVELKEWEKTDDIHVG